MQLSFCFSLPPPKVVLLSDSNESSVKLDLRDKCMPSQNEFKDNTVEWILKQGNVSLFNLIQSLREIGLLYFCRLKYGKLY